MNLKLFVWLVPMVLAAQCPVKFEKMSTSFTSWNDREIDPEDPTALRVPTELVAKIRNVSGKQIRAMRLAVWYMDKLEDAHKTPDNFTAEKLKVGQVKEFSWYNAFETKSASGWLLIPLKVLFEDGTTQEGMMAETGCYGELWFDRKHPRLTKLPLALKEQ